MKNINTKIFSRASFLNLAGWFGKKNLKNSYRVECSHRAWMKGKNERYDEKSDLREISSRAKNKKTI